MANPLRYLPGWQLVAMLGAVMLLSEPLRAADPTFVGILALAVDDEGARLLGLDGETREKLVELIAQREDQVQQLVLEIKDLPDQEKQARLAPFVAESERLGRELLTVEQRDRLSQLRLSRAGMVALADQEVSQLLGITAEQKEALQKLLSARAAEMTRGGEVQRRITHESYERRLRAVLTDPQLGEWERLAGLGAGQIRERPAAESRARPRSEKEDAERSERVEGRRAPQPEDDQVADEGEEVAPAEQAQLRFSFKGGATWPEVLEWLAEQADLALHLDDVPPGTFEYSDTRSYTPDGAINRLNRFLIDSGYTLIRSGNLLSVVNLEEANDSLLHVLVEYVPLDELDKHGEYEVVKCLFPLVKMEPEAAVTEFSPLCIITKPVALANSKQILIVETAGKLRFIRDIIREVENPKGDRESVKEFTLQYLSAEDLLTAARPHLGLEEDVNSNDDISVSTDPLGTRIFVHGKPDKIEIIQNLVEKLDQDVTPGTGSAAVRREQPELKAHSVGAANLQMVYDVLQTLLAGQDLRLAKENSSNSIVVYATSSVHQLVAETITRLEGEAVDFEIIELKGVDPQYAVTLISQMFGTSAPATSSNSSQSATAQTTVNVDAPRVDADPVNMRLFVRGKKSQIAAIRNIIDKLSQPNVMNRGMTRLLPYQGTDALRAIETLKRFWPGENPIQVYAPNGAEDSTVREVELSPTRPLETTPGPDLTPDASVPELRDPDPRRGSRETGTRERSSRPAKDRTAERAKPAQAVLTSLLDETGAAEPEAGTSNESEEGRPETQASEAPVDKPQEQPGAEKVPADAKPTKAPIIIQMTPQGILIQSEDLEALNRFEEIFRTIAGPQDGPFGRQLAVFYLKYAMAEDANRLLAELMGGKTSTSGSGGGLLNQVTSNVLGGGLLGLMAGGGGSSNSGATVVSIGSTTIVPDPRLNRLIVQGTAADIANIEAHLRVIDKQGSITDVETRGIPHIVQLQYTTADEAARVIRDAYASRIEGNQQRNQNPQVELFRALANRGNQQQNQSQEPKMTLAVDARSNSLVITAPEPLFREVAALIRILDQQGAQPTETYQVKTLKNTNGAVVSRMIGNLFAGQVITSGNNGRPGQIFGQGGQGNRGMGGQGNFGGGNFGGGNFGGGNFGGNFGGGGFGGGNIGFGGGGGGFGGQGGGQGRGGFGGGQGGGQGRGGGQGGGQGRGGFGGGQGGGQGRGGR